MTHENSHHDNLSLSVISSRWLHWSEAALLFLWDMARGF
jgi:hypothetical protein